MLGRMSEFSRVLAAIERGDPQAASQLLPLVYDELRRLAAQRLAHEQPGQTLQATALVHEAYLRLLGQADAGALPWSSRGHFFAAAAEAMRRILIERARRKQRLKHGGGRRRLDLDQLNLGTEEGSDDLLALDEAIGRLQTEKPNLAEIVMLRYYSGLSFEETAGVVGRSVSTIKREWRFARAWLARQLGEASPPSAGEAGDD